MEFTKLTARIADSFDVKAPVKVLISPNFLWRAVLSGPMDATPKALAAYRAAKMRAIPVDITSYETITTKAALDLWVDNIVNAGAVTIDTETTSLDAMQARTGRHFSLR